MDAKVLQVDQITSVDFLGCLRCYEKLGLVIMMVHELCEDELHQIRVHRRFHLIHAKQSLKSQLTVDDGFELNHSCSSCALTGFRQDIFFLSPFRFHTMSKILV